MSAALARLLEDEEHRRHEFPIARTKAYFAHAAVGPLPRSVAEAIARYAERAMIEGQFDHLHAEQESETRRLAARLLGATPDEIAFVPSTSAGLSTIASGLDWSPGDHVLVFEGDFPANTYPWLEAERRGVTVDRIPWNPDGEVTFDEVAARLSPKTRLVALSTASYLTGAPLDVEAIGRFLHGRGVLFCLDAIQTLGAIPLSVEHVDFVAADAHKWLLGPQGAGILYVRRDHQDRVRPTAVGWKSVPAPRDFGSIQHDLSASARRYEPGGLNVLGLIGLHAALALGERMGGRAKLERVLALRGQIVEGLAKRGRGILGPRGTARTGIVSFRPAREIDAILARLESKDVVISVRKDPRGERCIRIAPHFYTSDAEVEKLLTCC